MNGRTKQRQTFPQKIRELTVCYKCLESFLNSLNQTTKQQFSFHCQTPRHGPQSMVFYMESGPGLEKWSWKTKILVCKTDLWSVSFLLPSTLHKREQAFDRPVAVLIFPRQKNELLTILSRFRPGCRRRYLWPVGTILFLGTFSHGMLMIGWAFVHPMPS